MPEDNIDHIDFDKLNQNSISKPLIKKIYTADPSAHVFNGNIYIYPSHDIDAGEAFDDLGSHFAMEDYHVISMDSISILGGSGVDSYKDGEKDILMQISQKVQLPLYQMMTRQLYYHLLQK